MARQTSDNFEFPGFVVPEAESRAISYSQQVSYLTYCIKKLAEQVDALEERVKALEGNDLTDET